MDKQKRKWLDFYRRVARKRGGQLLSTEYVNSGTHLRWRCVEGHEWKAIPSSIRRGSWCGRCAGVAPLSLKELHAIARSHGGRCLATEYVNLAEPVQWRCAEGHVWTATGRQMRHAGTWCPRCLGRDKTIEDLQAVAAAQGGECLSIEVKGAHRKYAWRCRMGHVFRSTLASVMHVDTWCPRCRKAEVGTIARMRRIARSRGGDCLSTEYVSSQTKLSWRCREGHGWLAKPNAIVNGRWCPECGRGFGRSRPTLTLEDMQSTAVARGGKCLSTRYGGVRARYRWECANGHVWEAKGMAVRAGQWCPTCAHTVVATIDGMRALAAERGGRCLSAECTGQRTVLRWECAAGHRFEAAALAVKSGLWCPGCRSTHGDAALAARGDERGRRRGAARRGGAAATEG